MNELMSTRRLQQVYVRQRGRRLKIAEVSTLWVGAQRGLDCTWLAQNPLAAEQKVIR